ncbi:hypothetical protein R1flu_008454 [Riccia fluitans]|uniref:Uncharacterized protein n=1 Tax=Riccia fluitans TaxID=41844 RepID=A0ABD1YBQ6_9MARC
MTAMHAEPGADSMDGTLRSVRDKDPYTFSSTAKDPSRIFKQGHYPGSGMQSLEPDSTSHCITKRSVAFSDREIAECHRLAISHGRSQLHSDADSFRVPVSKSN